MQRVNDPGPQSSYSWLADSEGLRGETDRQRQLTDLPAKPRKKPDAPTGPALSGIDTSLPPATRAARAGVGHGPVRRSIESHRRKPELRLNDGRGNAAAAGKLGRRFPVGR